jgi:hypothetical protein
LSEWLLRGQGEDESAVHLCLFLKIDFHLFVWLQQFFFSAPYQYSAAPFERFAFQPNAT